MARLDPRSAKAGTAALTAGRGGRAAQGRWSRVLLLVGIFLFWWLLTAAVYRSTPSNFLRAESGWYLFLSHSAPAVQQSFEKGFFTKTFGGHYTPFAFLAEFETAKIVGPRAGFWKWRQITVLAILATALFVCVRASSCALGLTRTKAIFPALALTAILIFQVQMRDFIAWPYMIMQLFWLILSVIALLSLVRITQHPGETKWPWLAATTAYLSLHFLGLGVATAAATAVAMTGLWWTLRKRIPSQASNLPAPLLCLGAGTALHAIAMQVLPAVKPIPPWPGWKPGAFLMESLSFIANFVLAALRTLVSPTQRGPDAWQITQNWPYGLAILLGFALLVWAAFFRALREPSPRNQARFVLRSFASVSFLMIIGMVSIRQWAEPSPNHFADYLTGPRHLIPGAFALAGLTTELLVLIASLPLFLGVIVNLGLGISSLVGHLQFVKNIAPETTISHERAWHSIVAMARECQNAGLAIPNIPLGALTQEFGDWDLKLFEPLLRSDLKMPAERNLPIAPWNDFASGSPDEYSRHVPSLAEVRKRLNLNEKTQ